MYFYDDTQVNEFSNGTWSFKIADDFYADAGESYLTEPIFVGECSTRIVNDNSEVCAYLGALGSGVRGLYITIHEPPTSSNAPTLLSNNGLWDINASIGNLRGQVAPDDMGYTYGAIKNLDCTISTNLPIFESYAELQTYEAMSDPIQRGIYIKDHAINYSDGRIGDIEEFVYETIARNYTMDEYGNFIENTNQPEIYRGFKIRSTNRVSLFKIEGISDGKLEYGIKFADAIACYYSEDYGNTWQQVAGQPTTLPFNFTYRPSEGEVGTYYCAVGDGSNRNLFIFDNEEDATEYNSGLSDGRKASNYNQIISGDFDNPTGEEDEETTFGEVKTRGFFSQQYIMDATCLQALANDLFDTSIGGIWEAIKKGLDMYGDNPIEAVMGLSYWPIDLSTIYSGVSANYVWFGGYGWEPSAGTALRLTYPNGYKTLGTVNIRRTFRNWRDFSPYTRLYVSLPYVGVYELDLTKYYDKAVEVRYYFDTRTNGCIACLIAGGHLMDYFSGNCGCSQSITLTDFAGYANSQISAILSAGALAGVAAGGLAAGVVGIGGAAAGLAGTAIGSSGLAGAAAAAGAGAGFAGAAGLAVGGAGVAGTALGAKTVYGLSQNAKSKHNISKGGSSAMLNQYLPQYVEFIFEIQEDCAPETYGQQYGYPSMKSGSVGNFQGFLKCQSVKLDCGVATENEKNAIKTMLLNGIYI